MTTLTRRFEWLVIVGALLAPVHRVDMRLRRRFRLGANRRFDAMVEAFNRVPRMLQLGFRLAF